MKKKSAILLINLGTPESPSVADVRKYLTQFLNDPRVIDLSWIKRKLLVNGIIVPLRAPKSAKEYARLWKLNNGTSPLMEHGINLKNKLQKLYPENVTVELAMRYGSPSIPDVLARMQKENYDSIVVVPLYPHYASSSTGTVVEEVMNVISKWWTIPDIRIVGQFYDHPAFIKAFAEVAKKYNPENYDHILFSYHGLPERHVDKVYFDAKPCADHNCEDEITKENKFCYKAACYETTRLLAKEMGVSIDKCSTSFQSRLGRDPWIQPYTDHVLEDLANKGYKNLLVFSPAFVADCLETLIEIGHEYKEQYIEHGGENLQLVESLNSNDVWVNALKEILNSYI
jgi:protoporphyrin/coproporphyrin ferrochelatase